MEQLFSIGSRPDGKATPGVDSAEMASLREQAGSLWKMLDEMAESDPTAYTKFIEKQAIAARESAPASQTAPAVHAVVLQPRQGSADLVAVHIWPAPDEVCPMPKVDGKPILTSTQEWTGLKIACCPVVAPAAWAPPPSLGCAVAHYHCAVNRRLLRLMAANQPPELRGILHEAVCQWVHLNKGEHLQHQPRQLQVNSSLPGIKDTQPAAPPASSPPQPNILLPGMLQAPSTSKQSAGAAPANKKGKGPLIQELS